jgi:phage repressor protein C with HTH and peptisase S24 domain
MSDRNEWERDAAIWLAGRYAACGIDDATSRPPVPLARAAAGFANWRAALEREEAAARFAERVRARLAAGGRGMLRIDQSPVSLPALAGPLAPMLAAAGRRHAAPLVEVGVAAGTGRELLEEPCESWVALPSDLAPGRYLAMRVVGDSMVPLLHSDDVVLVDLDGLVGPGAVAVVRHAIHGYMVKRVGGVRPSGLRLESLNAAYPPLVLGPGEGSLIGRVVLRWCPHGPAKPGLAPAP